MSEPENLLTEWAALLVSSLADAGVRDVVMSPGSRSTPFVAAVLREPRLRMHVVIDERAAAFFALGQARLTNRPSMLLCTSGSAGAHYFPAVIEANAAGLPLLMVTADRPLELVGCGAAQTIDQIKLFGEHARQFFDLGAPDPSPLSLAALRRVAAQAVLASQYPTPGAVHLNARARKPLEPTSPATASPEAAALAAAVAELRETPIVSAAPPHTTPAPSVISRVAAACDAAERGLIVCGPTPASFAGAREAVFELARRTGFPLLCEATSQLKLGPRPSDVTFCDGFDAALRLPAFRASHAADVVLQLGAAPTSTGWEAYAGGLRGATRATRATRAVIAEHGWVDPTSDASYIVLGSANEAIRALASAVGPERRAAREAWAADFARAHAAIGAAASEVLAAAGGMTEGKAARVVLGELPPDSVLVLGNSLPIRAAEAFGPTSAFVTVLCQRGANGIDGLIAGACGAARSGARPVTLLLGDVTFLHDVSSLMLARELEAPLVIVVVNNGGGRIFEQLPLGRGPARGDDELRALYARTLAHVSTEHEHDLSHAARLFGHAHTRVASEDELRAALARAYASPACSIVEVTVPPKGAVEELGRFWSLVEKRLARATG